MILSHQKKDYHTEELQEKIKNRIDKKGWKYSIIQYNDAELQFH